MVDITIVNGVYKPTYNWGGTILFGCFGFLLASKATVCCKVWVKNTIQVAIFLRLHDKLDMDPINFYVPSGND